jgi:nucleoside-diphosphate-sugar epimerase
MSESGASRWRTLPAALAAEELRSWCPRIPLPLAITGATGFIGSHLLDALVVGGVRSRVLVRRSSSLPDRVSAEVEVVRGDMNDGAALATLVAGCGAAVHVAGVVRAGRPAAFDLVNRVGAENLVRALAERAPAARLVSLSSLAAVGPSPDPGGVGPEARPHPVSAYGRSKLAGEAAVRSHGGPWVILRPPTTYGPRETDVLQFFRLATLGVVPIPAGERFVTVAHVSDVVRAILAALAGAADNRAVHVGNPTPDTMRGMVTALATSGGLRVRPLPVPAPLVRAVGLAGDLLQWVGLRGVAMTSDKARELVARHWTARTEDSLRALGLAGVVPLPDGFAATWTWYRQSGWVPHAKMRARHGRHSERG